MMSRRVSPTLGVLLDTHQRKYRGDWVQALLLLLSGMPLVIIGFFLHDDGWKAWLFGLGLLLFGFIGVLSGLYHRSISIDLYTGGFVYNSPRSSMTVHWEDITYVGILIDRRPLRTNVFTIHVTTGERLVLNNTFERYDDLGESVMCGYSRLRGDIWDRRMLDDV